MHAFRKGFSLSKRVKFQALRHIREYSNQVRLAYLSDVHLEVNSFTKPYNYLNIVSNGYNTFQEKCHGIILAGDIGKVDTTDYIEFIHSMRQEFGQVFLVPGNHEYWDKRGYFWINDKLREMERTIPGLHVLLNGESHDLKINGATTDIRIIGGTLWSHLPSTKFKDNYPKMKDLTNLYFEEGLLISGKVYNKLFGENLLEFTDQFDSATNKNKKIVAISHHAPMVRWTCHPKFLGRRSYPKQFSDKKFKVNRDKYHNYAFSTDIGLIENPNLKAWIFGHTHYQCAYTLPQNALLASNPLGFHRNTNRFPKRELCVD